MQRDEHSLSSSARLHLFGPASVVKPAINDENAVEELRFRTQKSAALVGLLALSGKKPVSREWLAETLWMDQDPVWQRSRLRNELTFVSTLLGKEAIVRHGNSAISLSPSQKCDLWDFEILRDSVNQSDEPEVRIAQLREAISLAERGDFLPNLYEEPIVQARERLRIDLRLLLTNLIADLWKRHDASVASLLTLFQQRFPGEPVPGRPDVAKAIEPSAPPKPQNRFWGRGTEQTLIADWLAAEESPILTITGSPGIGKTRLAAQAAPGAIWVPCADVTNGSRLYELIRTAWGMVAAPGQNARETVLLRLRTQDTLLLLDNLEQIASTVVAPLQDLLRSAPRTRCLVTSRVPLRIPGETELRLEPLPPVDSRALFLDRARAVRPDFADTENTEAICALLDGVPLPLELAASHARTLPPADIRSELSDRMRFLAGARQATTGKHRSLRAAVEWSVQLLSAPVQRAFIDLCVFRGGFTPQAAEAFWTEDMPPREETLETLCLHSLVKRMIGDTEPVRYRLLPTIQAYGIEQMATRASGAPERHARQFARLVTTPANESDFVIWERDWENITAALTWMETNEPRTWQAMIYSLVRFWETRGFFADGINWCKRAADSTREARQIAWFRMQQSRFLFYVGDFVEGRAVASEAIRHARQCGATGIEAQALHIRGYTVAYQGDPLRGITLLEQACVLFTEIGDAVGEYQVLHNLGVAHLPLTRYVQAYRYLRQAERLARAYGDWTTTLMSLFYICDGYLSEERFAEVEPLLTQIIEESAQHNLVVPLEYAKWGEGVRRTEIGDWEGATPYVIESADFAFRVGLRWAIALVCEAAGFHACAAGEGARAARLLGFSERWRETVQFPMTGSYLLRQERYLARLRKLLSPTEFSDFWNEGREFSVGEAHRLATDF